MAYDPNNEQITLDLTPDEAEIFEAYRLGKLPGIKAKSAALKQLLVTHPDYIEAKASIREPAEKA